MAWQGLGKGIRKIGQKPKSKHKKNSGAVNISDINCPYDTAPTQIKFVEHPKVKQIKGSKRIVDI
jgi:hypothetical protein